MLIAGIDEAGRGPVIGPMVLGCVVIDSEDKRLEGIGVKDSKKLSPKKREALYDSIKGIAKESACAHVSASEIDELRKRMSLNELEALKVGELLDGLGCKPDVLYVDAPDRIEKRFSERIKGYGVKARIVSRHGADSTYPVCSAASILAKVERDREIKALAAVHGEIGSGYPCDPVTIKFLRSCLEKEGYPEIVRHSWDTASRLLGEKRQRRLDDLF